MEPPSLQVHVEQSAGVPVVRVAGEVDMATAPQLREHIEEMPEGTGTLIVDLTDVTFLDSTGLSVLVAAWKQLASDGATAGGDLRLVVVGPAIQKVLEITGLSGVFSIFSTVAEALAG
jgi:anti-anti-sigma factor